MTIRVSNATDIDTDTVTTKGGRVGALSAPGDGAVDTLVGETALANCGRSHLAKAIGVSGITKMAKRVRFIRKWTWSSSTSWATCRSARPAGRCCCNC